jgi:hypothetical protein
MEEDVAQPFDEQTVARRVLLSLPVLLFEF